MRKICIITGTRAEYGLLSPLMREINKDKELTLQLIVTGTHLSPEFGLTYKEIEQQFVINKKIEILLSSDNSIGISKTMGLAQISFSEAFNELNPDIILVLGDRYEIFTAASTAMISNIPIAHISGGELTLGAIDDSIRHAITKMSHIHFVATDIYKKRVMQLGEDNKYIFNFGEAGLDNIEELQLLNKQEFEKSINFSLQQKNILITYHPETLSTYNKILEDIDSLLFVLDSLDKTTLIFTASNADKCGRMINTKIKQYVDRHPEKSCFFNSLGQIRYLSALQHIDAVVGNSSSGIVEAPSFNIATINIGNRQKGRVQATSIINTTADLKSLYNAFKKLYSSSFQNSLKNVINPYKGTNTSFKTKEVLKNINLKNILHKEFIDL